jgi:hypothetical protein
VRRRWTPRATACLVAGTAVLTGCSEKQEARESLPSTSSASPTENELPTLGPEEFPVPDEARTQDAAGAEAFIDYYLGLARFVAVETLDPQPLLDLSRQCVTCEQIASSYSADAAAGYTYMDYSYDFDAYEPIRIDGTTAEVGFSYEQSGITVVDASGAPVEDRSTPASGRLESGASLVWDDAATTWLLTSLTVG